MYTLRTSATFDSAHFLSGYNGKCANIHGHQWKIEAFAKDTSLQHQGEKKDMLIDFSDFKQAVHSLADKFDHALIYEEGTLKDKTISALNEEGFRLIPISFRPTAERFAEYFYKQLKNYGLPISVVTVYETPENAASYQED